MYNFNFCITFIKPLAVPQGPSHQDVLSVEKTTRYK